MRCIYKYPFYLIVLVALMVSTDPVRGGMARADADLMFYIQRNIDERQVHYVLNRGADGRVDAAEPFQIFWMSASGEGERRNLNIIQRRFVYGVKIQDTRPERIEFRIAAYPHVALFLQKDKGKYQVYTRIADEWCVLQRIHVHLEDDNVINPNVSFVRLEGVNANGQQRISQIDN